MDSGSSIQSSFWLEEYGLSLEAYIDFRRQLDMTLAGNQEAQQRYDQEMTIEYNTAPTWVHTLIQGYIQIALGSLMREFTRDKAAYPVDLARVKELVNTGIELECAQEQWRQHTGYHWETVLATLEESGEYSLLAWYYAVREIEREGRDLLCKCNLLEFVILIHPCQLRDQEKVQIVRESPTLWDIGEHRTVRKILDADSRLQEAFEQHSATLQEREYYVRALVKGAITPTTIKKAEEQLERSRTVQPPRERPQAVVCKQNTFSAPPQEREAPKALRTVIKEYASTLAHLPEEAKKEVRRLLLKMDGEALQDAFTTMEQLRAYEGQDHHTRLQELYDQLSSRKKTKNRPTEAAPRSSPPEPLRENAITEGPLDVLDRLLRSGPSHHDMTLLNKAYSQNQIPVDRLKEYLRHRIFFRMAHDGRKHPEKSGRAFKILLASVVIRYVPSQHKKLGQQLVKEMVSSGELVFRGSTRKIPGDRDPVRLNTELRIRYGGTP